MSAVAIGALLLPAAPPRVWTTIAVCAVLPDLDAIGRPFHRGDIELLGGHRALTHSLVAFAVLGLVSALLLRRQDQSPFPFGRMWAALFVAIASHSVLDAFTEYGSGITFFAPFSWARQRSPWLPLSGLVSDTALFVVAAIVARIVIARRGWPVPRLLTPRRWFYGTSSAK